MNEIKVSPIIKGEFKDTIKYKDGRVEIKEDKNLIVNGIFNLITSLLADKGGYNGLQYWAIGQGEGSWNNDSPPLPTDNDTNLVSEIGRKALDPTLISWVNADNSNSTTPTNKLKVRISFGYNECVGTWREFGLFGGNATTTKDSGIMINHKNHGAIVKTTEMEIEREIVFTFTK